MKWCAFVILSIGISAQASYTVCPEHIFSNPQYKQAWTLLKGIQSRLKLGSCQIEIHICDRSETQTASDDIVGDLWLQNKFGKEQYLTFYFPKDSKGRVNAGSNFLRYRYQDTQYDEVNGNKEKVSLNIDLWDNNTTVASVLFSTYSSNDHDRFLGLFPMSIQSACFR